MAYRELKYKGDLALRRKCRPVEKFDQRLWDLLDDMKETLARSNGVGLAAPQVGVVRRVFIIDKGVPEGEAGDYLELINPEIIETEGEQEGMEGCLSVPGKWGIVKRPMKVRVRFLDRTGKEQEFEGTELMARAICHENDHLSGVLYTDVCERMLTDEEIEEWERTKEEA